MNNAKLDLMYPACAEFKNNKLSGSYKKHEHNIDDAHEINLYLWEVELSRMLQRRGNNANSAFNFFLILK